MTAQTLVMFFIHILLILLGVYAIKHEKELIKFERRIWRYIKAFFKALYYTYIKPAKNCSQCAEYEYCTFKAPDGSCICNDFRKGGHNG